MQEPVLSKYLGFFIKYFQGIFFFQKKKKKLSMIYQSICQPFNQTNNLFEHVYMKV